MALIPLAESAYTAEELRPRGPGNTGKCVSLSSIPVLAGMDQATWLLVLSPKLRSVLPQVCDPCVDAQILRSQNLQVGFGSCTLLPAPPSHMAPQAPGREPFNPVDAMCLLATPALKKRNP